VVTNQLFLFFFFSFGEANKKNRVQRCWYLRWCCTAPSHRAGQQTRTLRGERRENHGDRVIPAH